MWNRTRPSTLTDITYLKYPTILTDPNKNQVLYELFAKLLFLKMISYPRLRRDSQGYETSRARPIDQILPQLGIGDVPKGRAVPESENSPNNCTAASTKEKKSDLHGWIIMTVIFVKHNMTFMRFPLKKSWCINKKSYGTIYNDHLCRLFFLPRKQQCDASTSSRAPRWNQVSGNRQFYDQQKCPGDSFFFWNYWSL